MPRDTGRPGTKHPLQLFVRIDIWIEPSFPGRGSEHHGLAVVHLLDVARVGCDDRCRVDLFALGGTEANSTSQGPY
jgi:hypothetical protein